MTTSTAPTSATSRFGLAPPRRFALPALLLLLSERPSYGYSLHKELQEFRFGDSDRPATYRALGQLEADGLVASSTEAAAGQARRVYTITALGEEVLRSWMQVVKEEFDCLARVLRRYQATGTADAVLAEVQGGWAGDLGCGWSPVLPTTPTPRQYHVHGFDPHAADVPLDATGAEVPLFTAAPASSGAAREQHYRVVPDRSVVLIEARSTVGPINFGAAGLEGEICVVLDDGEVRANTQPTAHIEVAVDGLSSGNGVYDAELRRRIDARRFPTAVLRLRQCELSHGHEHYRLVGDLTLRGVTRQLEGVVTAMIEPSGRLVVIGEQVIDIRDFDIPCPTVLMLRFYPDVRVRLHVEAECEEEVA